MDVRLSDTERQLLRHAQRACRGKAGYVPVTVLLLLGVLLPKGRIYTLSHRFTGMAEWTAV